MPKTAAEPGSRRTAAKTRRGTMEAHTALLGGIILEFQRCDSPEGNTRGLIPSAEVLRQLLMELARLGVLPRFRLLPR